jgi:hypothetical protein
MSILSGTEDKILQKNLVEPHSEITYKGDVTLTVVMKLSPGLREVRTYGNLRKMFTNLIAQTSRQKRFYFGIAFGRFLFRF